MRVWAYLYRMRTSENESTEYLGTLWQWALQTKYVAPRQPPLETTEPVECVHGLLRLRAYVSVSL